MTLADKIKADIADTEKRKRESQGLLGGFVNAGRVINEGLLNPTTPDNIRNANRFKDSAFGLLGIIPGVGGAYRVPG